MAEKKPEKTKEQKLLRGTLFGCAALAVSMLVLAVWDSPVFSQPMFVPVSSSDVIATSSENTSLPVNQDGTRASHDEIALEEADHDEAGDDESGETHGGLVNINTATLEELQTLPGVGPTIAQNIVNYREQNGPFTSVRELVNVPRIGEKTLENLYPFITI